MTIDAKRIDAKRLVTTIAIASDDPTSTEIAESLASNGILPTIGRNGDWEILSVPDFENEFVVIGAPPDHEMSKRKSCTLDDVEVRLVLANFLNARWPCP